MAAPEYVPVSPTSVTRSYDGPPVVPEAWNNDRDASLGAEQPNEPLMGYQGPDQGYALTIANRLRDRLVLADGESADDVLAGAVQIGLKRASIYGRAPVVHDITMALNLWGFLREAPAELVAERMPRFDGVANAHHWIEMRHLVATVSEDTLRKTPAAVEADAAADWRSQLEL